MEDGETLGPLGVLSDKEIRYGPLGAFAELHKPTLSSVMSVCPNVCPSVRMQ